MYMFFYSLFTIYLQLYTNSSYIQNNSQKFIYSSGVDDVRTPGSRYRLGEYSVLYQRGQTGFLNFYSINYMISGFESVESSRGSRKTLTKAECLT